MLPSEFLNTEDFVKHIVAYKKYQEMKAELNIMKSKLDNPEAKTDIQEVGDKIENVGTGKLERKCQTMLNKNKMVKGQHSPSSEVEGGRRLRSRVFG